MSEQSLLGIASTTGLVTGMSTPSGKTDTPQKTQAAAAQFEALLVGQILKASHDEEGGWLDDGEDKAAGSTMQMADEYFARAITAHGGLGLAKIITKGLDKATADAASRSNPEK